MMENTTQSSAQKANPVKSFIAGGFGGMCNVIVGHPLDTIKVSIKIELTFKLMSSWF